MITGIDLNETIDFVSQFDKSEIKTIFKISAIPSRVQSRAAKLLGQNGEGALDSMAEAFRYGVKNILNLVYKTGAPVVFETERGEFGVVVAEKIIAILPVPVISEVGAKILEISKMSEQETKN